jgi:hypothetical protein
VWKEEKLHKYDRLNVGKVGRGAGGEGVDWPFNERIHAISVLTY